MDRLQAAGVRAWIGGGWGVDALAGEQTRPHGDLDLAIDADDEALVLAELGGCGFTMTADHRPTRFVLSRGGTDVDVHPVDFSGARTGGPGVQYVPGGEPFLYPAGAFAGGTIKGRPVPCISAVHQVRFHLGYEPRDIDRHDVRLLAGLLGIEPPAPYGTAG